MSPASYQQIRQDLKICILVWRYIYVHDIFMQILMQTTKKLYWSCLQKKKKNQ